MNLLHFTIAIGSVALSCIQSRGQPPHDQRQREKIDRGLVAVADGERVFLSWRLLSDDPPNVQFNVYETSPESQGKRLNDSPLSGGTNFVADSLANNDAEFFIRPVIDGIEGGNSKTVKLWKNGYHEIPIQSIDGYRPGDTSIADLDGDGDYEIVLHQISKARDNSHSGITGEPILDAYEFDGTLLWRINLGKNIREGEHYTQFMVYDLDGDGCAEVACKTADGTTDGKGNVIGDATADWRVLEERSKSFGRVLSGPEFFTVFSGTDGKALCTVDYIPGRDPINGWGGIGGNGGNDDYGNRCDRFLACIAYLDGKRPSVVMCRGVYGRIAMAAWDWREGELTQRWSFDSGIGRRPYRDASAFSGMGGHSLSVADVDEDGKDEIVYQAMVVDDDGTGLYSSGLRHGDAMHLSDLDPERPGLEIFSVQENEEATRRFGTPGAAMRDARTGEILWSHSPGVDIGSGLAADIDPRHPGCEAWGGPGGLRTAKGQVVGRAPRTSSWAIWWDGDLLRELVGYSRVQKWNWENEREETLFNTQSRGAPRGPNLVGDILGDWREELIMTSPDRKSLRVFTTTIPSDHRIVTLMQDHQYRLAIAWQNVVYNKPPHTSFFLGEGMQEHQP
ncbi:rhamnogalacturonan lyase [Stieleria sp. JC731]|uniref:rhamnogalacturonan lyase n=1 Tax=Pirellulaceae TaxID=2691357 RepID=UPI001E32E98B|nr:rhamnogalacturonan lyase [Stieleria sp. JC731]MCC9601488.1 rhamnogalacturonan lyase [Stieleria sp. JC731]